MLLLETLTLALFECVKISHFSSNSSNFSFPKKHYVHTPLKWWDFSLSFNLKKKVWSRVDKCRIDFMYFWNFFLTSKLDSTIQAGLKWELKKRYWYQSILKLKPIRNVQDLRLIYYATKQNFGGWEYFTI